MHTGCLVAAVLVCLAVAAAEGAEPRVVACDGGEANVAAQAEHVLVRGPCARLEISGSDNSVDAEVTPGAAVHVAGARNRVVLHATDPDGTEPVVTPDGVDNVVALAAPALAESPALGSAPLPATLPRAELEPVAGAIVLDGDGLNRMVQCGGRDVLIHASDGRFRLSGGCRSVTVDGDGTQIEAELQPGARITIGGTSVRLDYILTGSGAAPTLSVSGRGSTAVHVAHLVSILGPAPH